MPVQNFGGSCRKTIGGPRSEVKGFWMFREGRQARGGANLKEMHAIGVFLIGKGIELQKAIRHWIKH